MVSMQPRRNPPPGSERGSYSYPVTTPTLYWVSRPSTGRTVLAERAPIPGSSPAWTGL